MITTNNAIITIAAGKIVISNIRM